MNKGITIKVKKLDHNKKRKYTQKRKHKNNSSKKLLSRGENGDRHSI